MNINTMKKDPKKDSEKNPKKGSENDEQMARVNLNDFLLKGKYEGNPFVTNGDTMYIPDKHHTANISDLMSLISGVGSAAYTARVLNNR